MSKTTYFLQHWKLIIHILMKTKHFGVNNHWWSRYPSYLGIAWYQQLINLLLIFPIVQSYKAMRMRALSGWAPNEQAKQWFENNTDNQ